jgi:hypothetical protein
MHSGSPDRTQPTQETPRPQRIQHTRRERLDALLRDLGSSLERAADWTEEPPTLCPTGLPAIDALLGGGLPRGRLCEWSGPPSSGRTSLAHALLATTTRAGHCAGLVDLADAFDPGSAERAGVVLERILWVRPKSFDEARRCTERLLQTEGFPLVMMDLPGESPRVPTAEPKRRARTVHSRAESKSAARNAERTRNTSERDAQTWLRLTRLASGTRSALVVLSPERCSGTNVHIALEMQPGRARFSAAPVLLEEIEIEAVLIRHRAAPVGLRTVLHLQPENGEDTSRTHAA